MPNFHCFYFKKKLQTLIISIAEYFLLKVSNKMLKAENSSLNRSQQVEIYRVLKIVLKQLITYAILH
jgi:hypothetical protein